MNTECKAGRQQVLFLYSFIQAIEPATYQSHSGHSTTELIAHVNLSLLFLIERDPKFDTKIPCSSFTVNHLTFPCYHAGVTYAQAPRYDLKLLRAEYWQSYSGPPCWTCVQSQIDKSRLNSKQQSLPAAKG